MTKPYRSLLIEEGASLHSKATDDTLSFDLFGVVLSEIENFDKPYILILNYFNNFKSKKVAIGLGEVH